jgi:hypothetical protein
MEVGLEMENKKIGVLGYRGCCCNVHATLEVCHRGPILTETEDWSTRSQMRVDREVLLVRSVLFGNGEVNASVQSRTALRRMCHGSESGG